MTPRALLPLLAGALLATAGCDTTSEPLNFACPDIGVAGLSLTVTDQVTGARLWTGLTIDVADGAYRETETIETPPPAVPRTLHFAPWRRAGVYSIEVGHPDYLPWKRDGVAVVMEDACRVRTVEVDVKLTPRA